jgi:hypothetical protein
MKKRKFLQLALSLSLMARAAGAELADSVALEIARNPALASIAAREPSIARDLANEAVARMAAPTSGARSSLPPDMQDANLLRDNPLFESVYRHDPAAALDLLTRVKQAGGTKR